MGSLLLATVFGLLLWKWPASPETPETRTTTAAPAPPETRWQRLDRSEGVQWRAVRWEQAPIIGLDAVPERVLSQSLATDEILMELCPPGQIVGLSKAAADPTRSHIAGVDALHPPTVENESTPIIGRAPSLVFGDETISSSVRQALRKASIPLVVLAQPHSLETVIDHIETVGFLVGADQATERLIARIQRKLRQAQERRPRGARPTRALVWANGQVPGADTLIHQLLTRLGAHNVAAQAGRRDWSPAGPAEVATWDPELLIMAGPPESLDLYRRAQLEDPALQSIPAIQQGRVVVIASPQLYSQSQHISEFISQLGEALYRDPVPTAL